MSDPYPPEWGPTSPPVSEPRVEHRARMAAFWRRTFIVLGLLAVVMVITFSAYGVYAIRSTQTHNGSTLHAINDCTQPTGECYQRAQDQTAQAVGQIGAANILAVVCALQVPNGTPLNQALDQVTACVAAKLKAGQP